MPTLDTPIGPISYALDPSGALHKMWFGGGDASAGAAELDAQLADFFSRGRTSFDYPLDPQGTPFQKAVWAELLKIPCGETRSYQHIANAVGQPNATRAVGAANGQNPIAIIIPCHRVIGSNGKLTGYGGGLDMKAKLLAFESGSASLFE